MQDTANIFSGIQDEDTMGGRLQRARDAQGYSVADFASRLGVKIATAQAWENDRSQPRATKLQMVAGLLNVSLSWLMDGRGQGPVEGGAELVESIAMRLGRMQRMQVELQAIAAGLERDVARLAVEARSP